MANFDLTNLAVKILFPNNSLITDDAGLPSIMVYIPKFKNSDVLTGGNDSTHPAFIVNGVEIPGFYYSKYQNVVHNGVAYSLPGEDPATRLTFDAARECSEAKGHGWHLSTNAEWAAIALWCKKNGFLPGGNNDYGKDVRESTYKAVPTSFESDGKIGGVATGTGPLTWSHDKTMSGIWDMNGNIIEWQGGLRIVWGEIQILANNDAADPENPQNETSTLWRAINAANGALVEPECKTSDTAVKAEGETVKLDYVNEVWTYSKAITTVIASSASCSFYEVKTDDSVSESAKVLLRALLLLPDSTTEPESFGEGGFWAANGVSERMPTRGGSWINRSDSGLFYFNGTGGRTNSSTSKGFRAAYIPEI